MKVCINLLECLEDKVKNAKIAVAYVKKSGVSVFNRFLQSAEECSIVTSLDFGITELDGIKELRKLGCRVYLYSGDKEFHPKVYTLDYGNKKVAIIGSSNLSEGAITGKNIEFNLIAEEEEIVREAKSFINKLLSDSTLVTDELISQLESGGYEKIGRITQGSIGKSILSLVSKRGKYCEEFVKLFTEIEKHKNGGSLLSVKFKIHEMAIDRVACELTSYEIPIEVGDESDVIVYTGKPKIRIKVQGMVLPNKVAIVHELDFDYFMILLVTDLDSVNYFIIERMDIERLIKEGQIKYQEKLHSFVIRPLTYREYRSDLNDFIKRLNLAEL